MFVSWFSQNLLAANNYIYYANHTQIYKVDTGTLSEVASIASDGEVTDISKNSFDDSLFLLDHKNLLKYSSDNILVYEVDLQKLDSSISNPSKLISNPYDGSVWIAGGKTIIHVSTQGALIASFPINISIDNIALAIDSQLWVLAQNSIFRLDSNGNKYAEFNISSYVNNASNLAFDSMNDIVWVANNSALFQYNQKKFLAPPPSIQITDNSKIQKISLDYLRGVLWVVTNDTLRAYDKNRKLIITIPLLSDAKPVDVLIADSVAGSVWVGSKKALYNYNLVGGLVNQLQIHGELEALTSDVQNALPKPVINIISPTDNSSLNNNKPAYAANLSALCGKVSCDPGLNYYKDIKINANLGEEDFGSLFTISGNTANYTPEQSRQDGYYTLTMNATDIYGHISSNDVSRFIIDTTPPYFTQYSPVDSSIIAADSVTISGKTDDVDAMVALENINTLGGKIVSSNPSDFKFNVPLDYGLNKFRIIATDQLGNSSDLIVHIYRPQPYTLSVSGINDGMITSTDTITIQGSLIAPDGTTLSVNGENINTDENGNFTIENLALTAGANTISFLAVSPDGKEIKKIYTVYSGGGWSTPETISIPGDRAYRFTMGQDKQGNITVVWWNDSDNYYYPGENAYYLMTRRYIKGIGWQPIKKLTYVLSLDEMKLTVSENGDAVLIWSDCAWYCNSNGHVVRVFAQHFDAKNGWENSPVRLDPLYLGTTYDVTPSVEIDKEGNGLAVFKIGSQTYMSKYVKGNGWSPAELAFSEYSNDYSDRKVLLNDGVGKAVLGENVSRGLYNNVYIDRYDTSTGWNGIVDYTGSTSKSLGAFDMDNVSGNDIYVAYPTQLGIGVSHVESGSDRVNDSVELDGKGFKSGVYHNKIVRLKINSKGYKNIIWKGLTADQNNSFVLGFDYDPTTGWSGLKTLSQTDAVLDYIWSMSLAQNEKSTAVALWPQNDAIAYNTYESHMYASIFTNGQWSKPYILSSGEVTANQDVVLDENQVATAVWIEYNSTDNLHIVTSRFSPLPPDTMPSIKAPADIDREAVGPLTEVALGTAIATDPTDGALTVSADNMGPFPVGTNFVTWSATNSKGISVTTVQKIVIKDTTPPEITIPSDISINIDDPTILPAVIDIGTASASDIFEPVDIKNNAPTKFDIGTTNVTWTAVDIHGNTTTKIQKVTVNYTGNTYIRITYPVDGQKLSSNSTMIQGVVTGTVDNGIMVNGAAANVVNGKFYINNYILEPGDNTITATVTLRNGEAAESTISVSSLSDNRASVKITNTAGIAPLTTSFDVKYLSDKELGVVLMDFDGDGQTDEYSNKLETEFSHIYTNPGIYYPVVTIKDINGDEQKLTQVIVVYDPSTIDETFSKIWNDMNTALAAGNKEQALQYISYGQRAKYGAIFDALIDKMSDIVSSYSKLTRINVNQLSAEYTVTYRIDGKQYLYIITFIKDGEGIWHILQM